MHMDKSAYEIATDREREAIKAMLKERDRRLARFAVEVALRQAQDMGAMVRLVDRLPDEVFESICQQFWEDEG